MFMKKFIPHFHESGKVEIGFVTNGIGAGSQHSDLMDSPIYWYVWILREVTYLKTRLYVYLLAWVL